MTWTEPAPCLFNTTALQLPSLWRAPALQPAMPYSSQFAATQAHATCRSSQTLGCVQVEVQHCAMPGRVQLPAGLCVQACLLTEDFQGTCTDRVLHELIGGDEHPVPARCASDLRGVPALYVCHVRICIATSRACGAYLCVPAQCIACAKWQTYACALVR